MTNPANHSHSTVGSDFVSPKLPPPPRAEQLSGSTRGAEGRWDGMASNQVTTTAECSGAVMDSKEPSTLPTACSRS